MFCYHAGKNNKLSGDIGRCGRIFDGHGTDVRQKGDLTALGGGDGMGEGLKGWWEDLTWMLGGNDTADKVRDRVGDGNLNDLLTEGVGKKRGANEGGGNHEKGKRVKG